MATYVDSGGNNLVSLAGLRSAPGYGLQVNSYYKAGLLELSTGANPKRVWYLVQNSPNSTGLLAVYLAPISSGPISALLSAGDSFFIGNENPWTGPITIITNTGVCTYFETECELAKAAKIP